LDLRQQSDRLKVPTPRSEPPETNRLADAAQIAHGRMIYSWRHDSSSVRYEDRRAALFTSLWTQAEGEETMVFEDEGEWLVTELDMMALEVEGDVLSGSSCLRQA